ncbi:hypothetical protein E2C01_022831 [Portunus trituberculatus]|uniref:Uncharacterized protein n=1 Tax=Portunus trituberculatus TaxID=210409 RepID=A0A5B7E6F1_PORTR|nr:hypothetical protein [Portunus trituberculatus]
MGKVTIASSPVNKLHEVVNMASGPMSDAGLGTTTQLNTQRFTTQELALSEACALPWATTPPHSRCLPICNTGRPIAALLLRLCCPVASSLPVMIPQPGPYHPTRQANTVLQQRCPCLAGRHTRGCWSVWTKAVPGQARHSPRAGQA